MWNFKELFRQGALYRALPTALVGAVPKAVIHYSILNFYINTFAPDGDMKKADGQTATVIGAPVTRLWRKLSQTFKHVKLTLKHIPFITCFQLHIGS